MVFTAPRVRLRNSIFFLLLLASCNSVADKEKTDLPFFNADSLVLENVNGILYNNRIPFSGRLVKLNSNHDTLMVTGYFKGKENGEWKHFYENGQPEELRYFNQGEKINTLTRWWENGQVQFQCTFKNGEYDGVLHEWNENGQLTKEMHYHVGYENGSQKMYYDNGKIRSNYVIINGKRIGLLGTKNCVNVSDSVFKR